MIEEEIITGFCRTFNQSQTVTMEYEVTDGQVTEYSVDCAYHRCMHRDSCLLAQRIEEILENGK